jgi:ferrous iron transport protein A
MSTLDELGIGKKAQVARVRGNGELRRRLMDMGITHGVQIEVLKVAPMGDPIEYKLRGYHLSLRKSEACLIEIEPVESAS